MGSQVRYNVRGTHVIAACKWIDERLGAGAFADKVAQVDCGWPRMLVPSAWYGVYPLEHAIAEAARELDLTVEDASADIARRSAHTDLATVYRKFLLESGPQQVMSAPSVLWRNYVAFADARKVTNEPGRFVGECRQLPVKLLDWACGCWRGLVPTAIELAGGRNCCGRITACGRDDGESLSWLVCEVTYD